MRAKLLPLSLFFCLLVACGRCGAPASSVAVLPEPQAAPPKAPAPYWTLATSARDEGAEDIPRSPRRGSSVHALAPGLRSSDRDQDALWLPAPEALDTFFAALADCESGSPGARAAVFHLGDSHTAADLYTDHLRLALQRRFGDRGHGWLHPGRAWKSYYPRHTEISSSKGWSTELGILVSERELRGPFGLGGVTVRSSRRGDRITVAGADDGEASPRFGLIDVFYLNELGGGDFRVDVDGETLARVKTETGGGIGPGVERLQVSDAPHQLELVAEDDRGVALFGLALERDVPGLVYDSVGINGARATDAGDWEWCLLASGQLARRAPSLVVVAYGSNEAGDDPFDPVAYTERFFDLLVNLQSASTPRPACLVVAPPERMMKLDDGTWQSAPRLREILGAQREAAAQAGCAVFDTYGAMGGAGSMDAWATMARPLAQSDRVHLTRRGYRWMARALYESLMGAYARYQHRSADEHPGSTSKARQHEGPR